MERITVGGEECRIQNSESIVATCSDTPVQKKTMRNLQKSGIRRGCMASSKVRISFFDKASRNWETAWQEKLTPWDLKGTVCPPLVELIHKGLLPSKEKNALIPGCGSGYECMFLRQAGFQKVTGLDLSATAIQAAKENLSKSPAEGVDFECADFFYYQSPIKYDFIFDYLFFSAIDPPMRVQWAQAMSRHLASDGVLATLMFPLNKDCEDNNTGPPYPITVEDYNQVLSPLKIDIFHIDKDIDSIRPRKGREIMVLWKKSHG